MFVESGEFVPDFESVLVVFEVDGAWFEAGWNVFGVLVECKLWSS